MLPIPSIELSKPTNPSLLTNYNSYPISVFRPFLLPFVRHEKSYRNDMVIVSGSVGIETSKGQLDRLTDLRCRVCKNLLI